MASVGAKDLLDTANIPPLMARSPFATAFRNRCCGRQRLMQRALSWSPSSRSARCAQDGLLLRRQTMNPAAREVLAQRRPGAATAADSSLRHRQRTGGSIVAHPCRCGVTDSVPLWPRAAHGAMNLCWSLDKLRPCRSVEDPMSSSAPSAVPILDVASVPATSIQRRVAVKKYPYRILGHGSPSRPPPTSIARTRQIKTWHGAVPFVT